MKVRNHLYLVAIVAVLLRLGFVAVESVQITNDSGAYDRLAHGILDGSGLHYHTQLSAERTPGYPLFVAAIYALGGSQTAVAVVQVFIEGLCILLIGSLGALLRVPSWGILSAAWLTAIFPPLVTQPSYFMTESLYQIVILVAVIYSLKARNFLMAGLAGLFWGLTCLVRPTPLPFVFLLGAVMVLLKPTGRRITGVVLIAACLVTLAPWLIRNQRVLGAPVLSTFGWQNIYAMNSRLADSDWATMPAFLSSVTDLCVRVGWGDHAVEERSDVQVDSLCRTAALNLIKENPVRFIEASAQRVARLWFNLGYGRADKPPSTRSILLAIFMGGLMAVGIVGFFLLKGWRSWPILAVTLLLLFNTAIHAVSVAYYRFNQPMLPIFFLFTAWAAAGLWQQRNRKPNTAEQIET